MFMYRVGGIDLYFIYIFMLLLTKIIYKKRNLSFINLTFIASHILRAIFGIFKKENLEIIAFRMKTWKKQKRYLRLTSKL